MNDKKFEKGWKAPLRNVKSKHKLTKFWSRNIPKKINRLVSKGEIDKAKLVFRLNFPFIDSSQVQELISKHPFLDFREDSK